MLETNLHKCHVAAFWAVFLSKRGPSCSKDAGRNRNTPASYQQLRFVLLVEGGGAFHVVPGCSPFSSCERKRKKERFYGICKTNTAEHCNKSNSALKGLEDSLETYFFRYGVSGSCREAIGAAIFWQVIRWLQTPPLTDPAAYRHKSTYLAINLPLAVPLPQLGAPFPLLTDMSQHS